MRRHRSADAVPYIILATQLMSLQLILLSVEADAESGRASMALGYFAFIILFAVAALKCSALLARPQTHKLCVGALTTLLLTFTLSLISAALRNLLELPPWMGVASFLLCSAGLVSTLVMAIIGLIDYRRRSDLFNQGRVQAWFAFGIALVPACLVTIGFARGFIEGARAAMERNASRYAERESDSNAGDFAAQSPDTGERSEQSGVKIDSAVQPAAHEAVAPRPRSDGTQHFDDLNFEFTPPDEGWIKLHAASVSADANVAYTSKAPQVIFFVIAEQIGVDVDVTVDALLEVVKANLYASFEEVEFENAVSQTVGGIEGVSVTATYTKGVVEHRRAMWLGARGGFLYQLITTGREKYAEQLDSRHDAMLAGFRVLDRDAVVYSEGKTPLTNYASSHYGYRVDLSGAPWLKASADDDLLPAAEVAATLKGRAAFAVVPLVLPYDGATVEDASSALASVLIEGFDVDRCTDFTSTPAKNSVEEVRFRYVRSSTAGVTIENRFRILRQGRRAVMAVGWAAADETELLAEIDQALGTLQLDEAGQANNDDGEEQQRFWRGMAVNRLGMKAFDRQDLTAALACFEEAIKLQPKYPTALINYAHILAESGKPEQAVAELEKRIDQYEDKTRLREKYAEMLLETGDEQRCCETLQQLLAEGHRSEETLLVLVGVQMGNEEYEAALAAVDGYLAGGPSPQATQIKAALLSKLGKHDESIAILEEIRKSRPRDVSAVIGLAVAYHEAKRFDEALQLTQELLDTGKPTESIHLLRGRCQIGLKLYQEAKESFEAAQALNPRSEDAKEWIAVASSMLGQGNNSLVKTPIDPVPLPAEIAGRLTQIPANDAAAGTFGAYEKFRVVGYEYRRGERWRSTTYRQIKIVGQEGVDRFSTLTVTFNPLGERVFVNRLAVYDAAGKLAAEGNAGDYYVAADSQSELATGDNTLTIPIPQLQPGSTLEFTYTRESFGVEEFGYENVMLTSSIPVQAAAAFVVGDVDKLAYTSSGPEPRQSADGGLFWGMSDPPVYVDESSQPPVAEFLPVIHLTDAGQEWNVLGDEYAEQIADRLKPDAIAAAKATELTQGIAGRDEKIAVLTRFVQKQLNYQGLEFGVRGLMPNTAAKSLENGYGDCKDHSVLLKQLLDAAGIPAQVAIVNSSGDVDGRLPSASQFDHMIVSIPGPDGSDVGRTFVDCTAKYSDPRQVTADEFNGRLALLIESGASRLVPIAPRTTLASEIRCGREVTIVCDEPERETADAVVREQVQFSSTPAGTLRSILIGMQPRDRKEAISRLISDHGDVEVTRLEVVNLEDPAAPLILQLEYRMDNVFHRVGDGGSPLSGRLVSPWETWVTTAYAMNERLTPFRTTGAAIVGSTRYVLPSGFTLDRGLESVESPPSNSFVTWRVEANPADGTTLLHVDRRSGSHPASAFASCSAEAKQFLDRLRRPIAIREISSTAQAPGDSTVR